MAARDKVVNPVQAGASPRGRGPALPLPRVRSGDGQADQPLVLAAAGALLATGDCCAPPHRRALGLGWD